MKLFALLLTIFVGSCFAQDAIQADSLSIAPIDICATLLPVDIDSISKRLEAGELGPSAESASSDLVAIPIFRCENGPKRIIHTVPNEFHWPPIYRGTCDNLYCKTPPCFARKTRWVSKCVHIFKLVNWRWVYAGRQTRYYLDHLECGCKKCEDIYNQRDCINTKPCPNSYNFNSFCYWSPFIFTIKPPTISPVLKLEAQAQPNPIDDAVISPIPLPIHGRCRCCTPVPCKRPKIFVKERCRCECPLIRCPPGQIFNRETCECDCPKGSKKNSQGQCVGDCEDISLTSCIHVTCADNQHFQCKRDKTGEKCVCPSCDDANAHQCSITNCLEQRTKPMCKYDQYSQKCRCPRCEDSNDKYWCDRTYCGPNYHLQCSWNTYYHTCSCPH